MAYVWRARKAYNNNDWWAIKSAEELFIIFR